MSRAQTICVIGVGAVVDPFQLRIVIRAVAHQNELPLRKMAELRFDGCTVGADGFDVPRQRRGRENSHLHRDQHDAHHNGRSSEKDADRSPIETVEPHVAQALQ